MRFSFGLIALTAASANALVSAPDVINALNQITNIANSLIPTADSLNANKISLVNGVNGVTHRQDTDKIVSAINDLTIAQTGLSTSLSKKQSFVALPVSGTIVNTAFVLLERVLVNTLNAIINSLGSSAATSTATSLVTNLETVINQVISVSNVKTN